MAKVLGQSGRYVSEQAVQKRRKILNFALPVIILCAALEGFLLGYWLFAEKSSSILNGSLFLAIALLLVFFSKQADKKLDALEREMVAMQRGATGEIAVGFALANFPDEFCVINDLTTPFGNLDHVVVGPTGVFNENAKQFKRVGEERRLRVRAGNRMDPSVSLLLRAAVMWANSCGRIVHHMKTWKRNTFRNVHPADVSSEKPSRKKPRPPGSICHSKDFLCEETVSFCQQDGQYLRSAESGSLKNISGVVVPAPQR